MGDGVREAVGVGDVVRERWPAPGEDRVPLYLGSGRCGACFDAWGLMHAGAAGGATVLMHADHLSVDAAGAIEWLPLARLVWADGPPPSPVRYRQHLDLYDGRLTTELNWPGLTATFAAQFHPGRRDVLGVDVRYESDPDHAPLPALLLAPQTPAGGGFDATGATADGIHCVATVRAGTAETLLGLNVLRRDGTAEIAPGPAGARVEFAGRRGSHLILIAAGVPARGGTVADDLTTWNADRHVFADSAAAAWHKRWVEAYTDAAGDAKRRMLAARSLYYLLCSFAPESHAPAPPHGWTGNGRLAHDPVTAAEVVPVLLRFGHADLARGIVESYRGRTHDPLTAGLAAGMAAEASTHGRDDVWSREVAWPLVHDAARQFALLLKEGPGGTWSLDDAALAAPARDTLRAAVAMAGELGVSGQEFANYRGVLSDGISQPAVPDGDAGPPRPETDAETVQLFAPQDGVGGSRVPYHLASHARFLRSGTSHPLRSTPGTGSRSSRLPADSHDPPLF